MQLPLASLFMAGMKGFEPLVMESKSIALTAWLHPYLLYKYYNRKFFENQVLFNFWLRRMESNHYFPGQSRTYYLYTTPQYVAGIIPA